MNISHNTVVAIDYTLTNDEGEVLDSSSGRAPLYYLHGYGNIIPGLENALAGHTAGESLAVTVAPADGYGEHDPEKLQAIPRQNIPPHIPLEPGLQLTGRDQHGNTLPLWVFEVREDVVLVDGNHPLAGETLHFAVEIREVRAASSEELAHGHVHGPGGVH